MCHCILTRSVKYQHKVFDTLQMSPTVLETIRWTVCIHVCVFLLSPLKSMPMPADPWDSWYQMYSLDCILVRNE